MNNDIRKITLEDLGYNDFFRSPGIEGRSPARVTAAHKEAYILRTGTAEYFAKITGKMMFTASGSEDYPVVGDWVMVSFEDKGLAVIHDILPRKTVLKRKSAGNSGVQIIASNIDTAYIVESIDRDYSLNRFERYITIADSGGIRLVLILNKTDLVTGHELESKLSEVNNRFEDLPVLATSTVSENGITGLKNSIKKGMTYCFLGSSGVGKTSLINSLMGKDILKTSEINIYTQRGKHTTSHRELFILETGGLVIDNPGMREIGLVDSEDGIGSVFDDISALSDTCRFSDCNHTHETGCAVLKAVGSGELDKAKYENYMRLVKENEFNSMSKLEKRQKDRNFGKFCKKVMKYKKKHKY
ncbi:MAG: ribosome small subunit-dependent GTPase A [Elusimicrobiota bacterium]